MSTLESHGEMVDQVVTAPVHNQLMGFSYEKIMV